jgi:hypothetical protein
VLYFGGNFGFRNSSTSSAVGGRSTSSTRRKTAISNGSGEAAGFVGAPASCPALPPATGDCAGTRITPTGAATTSSHTNPRHHQRRQEKDISTTSPWKRTQDAASLQDFFFASTVVLPPKATVVTGRDWQQVPPLPATVGENYSTITHHQQPAYSQLMSCHDCPPSKET